MLRFIFFLLLVFPVTVFAQEWKTFSDTAGMFTAKYPAGWTNKIKTGNRVFFTSPAEKKGDDFYQNINISVTTHPDYGSKLKIKDLAEDVIAEIKNSFSAFTEESRKYIKWNGFDAIDLTYTGKAKSDESTTVRITQRFCFYKTRLYLVTYAALKDVDVYQATAMQIINGIKFTR